MQAAIVSHSFRYDQKTLACLVIISLFLHDFLYCMEAQLHVQNGLLFYATQDRDTDECRLNIDCDISIVGS